jgi:DNA-damage-inducible protein J
MAQTTINLSLDEEIKKQADSLLEEFGMDMNVAFNVFVKQMLREHSFPFPITTDKKNSPGSDLAERVRPQAVKFGGWEGKIWVADNFDAPIDLTEYAG